MKTILSIAAAVIVVAGGSFLLFHNTQPVTNQAGDVALGGLYQPNVSHFASGFYAGGSDQFYVDSSGNATTTGSITAASLRLPSTSLAVSSSSPAVLGAATRGQFVVAASATTANASTTAMTVNSLVFVQNTGTTTIPGVTCNTTVASSTQVTTKIAGNGFIVKVVPSPATNPYCLDFHIINP